MEKSGSVIPDTAHAKLRLLNLTDLHMEIRPYDYFADAETKGGGLAKAASLITQLRDEVENCLLFDNGDILQGNPMGDLCAEDHATGKNRPHPMIAALNVLRPDAASLGNHEFNYGLEFLETAVAEADYPIVSANLLKAKGEIPEQDQPLFPPYVLLRRVLIDESGNASPITVGVIGFLPPQVLIWDRKYLEGRAETRDIVETAQSYISRMVQEGADLIVALSHSGIEHNVHTNTREHASLSLAAVDGIDVIITGHSHQVFPSHDFEGIPNVDATAGLLHGKPATMAGFGGSHVGVVDLSLQQGASGWSVNMATAKSLPVPRSNRMASQAERKILAITKDAHERTLNYIRKAVGRTNQPLDSHFAMLQPASSVRFVATAQHQFLRKKLLDTQHAALPFLSAAAPFKMGGRGGPDNFADVPAGDIAIRNVADLYGYPNMIRALAVDTTQLLDWLEFSACIFNQIEPGGTDQPLIDPTFPSYNFDSICGLSYEIDISKPARFTKSGEIKNPDAQRISNVTWNGTPVDRSQIFVVATNDYRASRSGTYPGADAGELVFSAPEALQDILVKFLQETKPSRSLMPPPWALAPCSGASVYFDTSVKALESATALVLGAVPQGQTDHGFMRFRKVL